MLGIALVGRTASSHVEAGGGIAGMAVLRRGGFGGDRKRSTIFHLTEERWRISRTRALERKTLKYDNQSVNFYENKKESVSE
jgi:hypothetical protein